MPRLLPYGNRLMSSGAEVESAQEQDLVIPDLHARPGLLFHINRRTGLQRLCIPSSLVKDIIGLAHNSGHPGLKHPCIGVPLST